MDCQVIYSMTIDMKDGKARIKAENFIYDSVEAGETPLSKLTIFKKKMVKNVNERMELSFVQLRKYLSTINKIDLW